ncbi:biosynthetic arginine decarboxylase [Spirochaeta lutea]|uniref:Biosynthetic arginine decarboxylase n=1 Tax=Spirochaeta lutea TaxID=1480694 RepID=A0A098QVL4_9SPIO|nr:biosynthetic arginine decarboxylase [Spirochaeta lutea]KGE71433.1 arginine decarboxylase [Spirochaeta lutea]
MAKKQELLERWSIGDSANVYGIKDWGAGYFDLSNRGEVVVRADFPAGPVEISLMDIISGINDRGMAMPVLLRIENLLDGQISRLNTSFRKAIKTLDYQGTYQGVFPIKVNQQAQVIEEVTRFGARFNHGLEAGSKAELIIALSMIQSTQSLVVCNGYKDEEFIELGLQAVKMGYKCFFVIETPAELPIILRRSKDLGIRPLIGIRLKLSSRAGGHWQDSGGDNSIFGLTTNQMVDVLDTLKAQDMLDCLQLLHYHLGSQIPNIRDIRAAVRETARFYADLVTEGAKMGYIDLGGGLAVDYDGSQTNFIHSKNYSLDEYTTDVIEVLVEIFNDKNIPHPTIITESGRATVAYSSILLFNVLDVNRYEPGTIPSALPENSPELLENLWYVKQNMTLKNVQECYNDAIYYREEIREQFKHGNISLRQRAFADNLFMDIIHRIAASLEKLKRIPPELEGLDEVLYDIYYGNFSVFQSLPDAWAIEQIFPLMPIHRLREQPSRRAILADITCDSDGKIDRFADLHDVRKALPLHDLKAEEEYYLGVFLVGAYQETLGDLHNLLGDTNVVSVRINENGSFDFVREIEGDAIWDVLSYVEYEPKSLVERFRAKAEQAVRDGKITVTDRRNILAAFEASIRGYTYYEK